jgi:flagellar biosynthesis protein
MSPPADRAVALEYGENPIPLIIASGDDDLAQAIVDEATRQGVPIMRDPVLAARLAELPVGAAIPRDVYLAVAVVLSWVYWMQGKEPDQASSARRIDP